MVSVVSGPQELLPMSLRMLWVRARVPELSSRLRLLAPCFRVSMWTMARRNRAWGTVPRLGPAGFSLVMVWRGTGWTPGEGRGGRKG